MTIRIEGMDELLKRITTIRQFRHVKAQFRKAGMVLKGYVARYPGQTEANDSSNQRWYQRGYGSKWRTKSGAVHGRKTSKKLGQSWTVSQPTNGFFTVIGTNVDYAPFVQDRDFQARYHRWRGWITTQGVVGIHSREVIEYIKQGIEEELAGVK